MPDVLTIDPQQAQVTDPAEEDLLVDDLIEDISIDGMCGVY